MDVYKDHGKLNQVLKLSWVTYIDHYIFVLAHKCKYIFSKQIEKTVSEVFAEEEEEEIRKNGIK